MECVENMAALRQRILSWRAAGDSIAFVPTMGNLHVGHLSLVSAVRPKASRVVASIFVNPLQFGPDEDLDAYPRTMKSDRDLLEAEGTDLLFAPGAAEVYSRGQARQTRVEVPGLSDTLCGASRPGHFVGVATVVCKLFNMVQPDFAAFGEKDFQQLLVIRRMAEDLCFPIEIIAVPTVREEAGLAMSSRNAYLTDAERSLAPVLYRTLVEAGERLQAGILPEQVEQEAWAKLEEAGLRPDYVSVRNAENLQPVDFDTRALVVLVAAYLGKARLIDNLQVDR